jgi:DNA replication protein DnaC
MEFKKVEQKRVKAKILITGTSGSGKSAAAILLAKGLALYPESKIGVIDTSGNISFLKDLGNFDVLELTAPYTTQRYIECVDLAEKDKYDVVIVDSLSPSWSGVGGARETVDRLSSRAGNTSSAWSSVQTQHDELMRRLLDCNAHVIVTLQVKTEYVTVTDPNGKVTVKKVGLAPIYKEGIEERFHVTLSLDNPSHLATTSSDHTGLFEGFAEVIDESHGEMIHAWCDSSEVDTPEAQTSNAITETSAPITEAEPAVAVEIVAVEQPSATLPGQQTACIDAIDADQVKTLESLLKTVTGDRKKSLAFFEVEKLELLPAAAFDKAVRMVEAKKNKELQQAKVASETTPAAASETTSTDTSLYLPEDEPLMLHDIVEALKARKIKQQMKGDVIYASPDFSDPGAKEFLKELGFLWDKKATAMWMWQAK